VAIAIGKPNNHQKFFSGVVSTTNSMQSLKEMNFAKPWTPAAYQNPRDRQRNTDKMSREYQNNFNEFSGDTNDQRSGAFFMGGVYPENYFNDIYVEKIYKRLSERDPYYYKPQKPETKYDKIRKGK
jgi:hypothetical protein